ncbi:MAG: hypothetical protein R3C52_13685 [Hyphomonadaceae bacterium]
MSTYDLTAWPLFRSVIDDPDAAERKPRTCFVICAGKAAGPDRQRHTDIVWKYVLRPALLDTDHALARTPEENSGSVDIRAMLAADIVVAIASGRDPDVYYAVALAQAASRPLVILVEEGQELGFDPAGAPVVTYSLDPDSVFSAVNVRKLQAALQGFLAGETPAPNGLIQRTSALGGASVYERSRQFTYDQRIQMLRDARVRIDIMGIANMALALHPDMMEVMRLRSGEPIEIRVLQCAPGNPILSSLIGVKDVDQVAAVKSEIEAAGEAWRRLMESQELDLSLTVRRAQATAILNSAIITEHGVVTTPYLYSQATAESPTIRAEAGSAYHRVMMNEFDAVWAEAATHFRYERRKPQRAATGPANLNVPAPPGAMNGHSSRPSEPAPAEAPPAERQRQGFSFRGLGGGN